MRIDCSDCQMQGSEHCDDCLVTALVHPEGPVEIDKLLSEDLGALSKAGLVPVLRFKPKASPEPRQGDARSA